LIEILGVHISRTEKTWHIVWWLHRHSYTDSLASRMRSRCAIGIHSQGVIGLCWLEAVTNSPRDYL
jgi:hypothetical protein